MYIKKINVSKFGKISNLEMLPSKGLNVIYAPNESGKTTLLSFVKYMFYGSRQKKSPGDISFKERYMPWSGDAISGSMDFDISDSSYSVSRVDGDKNSKLSVFDVGCGSEVTNISSPGQHFLGFGERAFDDSCFIKNVLPSSDSGGELMSYLFDTNNDDKLYYKVKNELSERLLNLSSDKRKNAQLPSCNARSESLKTKLLQVQEEIKACDLKLESICSSKDEIQSLKSKNSQLIQNLKKEEYKKNNAEMTLLLSQKEELENKLCKNDGNKAEKQAEIHKALACIWIILFVLTGILGFLKSAIWFLCPVFFVLFFVNLHKILKNKIIKSSEDETYSLINDKISYLDNVISQLQEKNKKLRCEMLTSADSELLSIKNFTNSNINDIITENESKIQYLENDIRAQRYAEEDRLRLCFEESLIKNELEMLEIRKNSLKDDISAVDMAIQILDEAFADAKNNLFPQLKENCERIYSYIVNSEQSGVAFNDKLEMHLLQKGSFRDFRSLSRGTADVLYFSFRVALVEFMSQSGCMLPIFIDDIFAAVDDERCYRIMDIIYKIAQKHQVFLCTCRSREGEYFKENVRVFEI